MSGWSSRLQRDRDVDVWQSLLGLLVVVLSFATVRPLGLLGEGLLVLGLLVVNSALLAQRVIPERLLPERWRLRLLVLGAVSSAALLGVASLSIATVFPYFVSGHAGFRLPARQALGVAALTTVGSVLALLVAAAAGRDAQPWWFGLLVGLPVLIGQSNREHDEATQAARALAEQTRRTAAAQAEAKALAERGRIARDVHDVLAHSLAAVNMQLEVADALLEGGRTTEAREATRRAQSLVREGLGEVQRTVHTLREDVLPVAEALERLVTSSGGRDDSFSVVGPPRPLATEVTQTLVRCAQEGLTNARRHAGDAAVWVRLGFDPHQVTLEVLNAAGARPAGATEGSGLGLVGMRERVALAGGTVSTGHVSEGPAAGGWRIHVVIPT